MAPAAAPPLPISHAACAPREHHRDQDAPPARRRCGRGACSTLASSPTRGMAIIMSLAATAALAIGMLQLADGQPGERAATTLYLAAGFNLLFTALYAPLIALFTLRAGFFKAVGALLTTIAMGLAYTLGLLFISAVLLVALSSVFG
jgi:hypothetical protein